MPDPASTFVHTRPLADGAIGLAVFTVLSGATGALASQADLFTTAVPGGSIHVLAVLAVAFSALFALNIAFARHVGRAVARARVRRHEADPADR